MATKGTIRTGTAGWVYEPWRGTFFPTGLVQKKELAYASSHLSTIEINATFRANQKPESFAKWAGEAPDGFVFSVKGPQLVTHIKRLKNCTVELANFFASGPLAMGAKLGPFIWQLPPNLAYDPASFSTFLDLLPTNPDAYLALARQSDERLKSAPFLDLSGVAEIRHAIETRHPSFAVPGLRAQLAARNIALVISDTPEQPGRELTADFAYCRLQGPPRPDATGYTREDIADWAKTVTDWAASGRDVFAYFVHEDKLHAPANAIALRKAAGVTLPADEPTITSL